VRCGLEIIQNDVWKWRGGAKGFQTLMKNRQRRSWKHIVREIVPNSRSDDWEGRCRYRTMSVEWLKVVWRTVMCQHLEPIRRLSPTPNLHFLWPPCIADADIIFLPCGLFPLHFCYLISAAADCMFTILPHIIIIILFVLNQTTQHMTAMQMNRTNKAQRALIVAINA